MRPSPDPSTLDGRCSPRPRRREDWSQPIPAAASSAKAAPATVEAVALAAVAVAAPVTALEKPAMVDIEQVVVSKTAALSVTLFMVRNGRNGYPWSVTAVTVIHAP